MAQDKAEHILDELISFIRKERELYGDFSVESLSEPVSTNESLPNQTGSVESESIKQVNEPDTLFTEHKQPDIYNRISDCSSLDELEALCRLAEVLKTDLEGTQLVFGVGNPQADLMLIGEAPGAEEDKQGEPFVGPAGKLLNKILAAINFKREDIYITNILKHRPPGNRNPLPEERKRSLPFLLKQIDLINPKLILSLGKVSAQTLLGREDSLSRMRGSFHAFREKYELLATYHPAALLRHSQWKRPTWEDVQMLRKRYDELGGKP